MPLLSQGIDLCVVKAAELNHIHIPIYTEEGKQFLFFIFFNDRVRDNSHAVQFTQSVQISDFSVFTEL